MPGISLCIPSPFKRGGSVMLTVEEVREAVKASPFYEKWGNEKDMEEIIVRIKEHIDPFSLYNYNVSDGVGEVYAGS
jgi:hypothetical protein